MEKVDDCTNPDNDFSLKQLIPSLGVGRTLAVDYNYPTLTFS